MTNEIEDKVKALSLRHGDIVVVTTAEPANDDRAIAIERMVWQACNRLDLSVQCLVLDSGEEIKVDRRDEDDKLRNYALSALKALPTGTCSSSPHVDADGILCDLLRSLGFEDVVEAYEAVEPKWYE